MKRQINTRTRLVQRYLIQGVSVVLSAALHVAPALATEPSCKRPELEWENWLAFTQQNNPGVDFVELEGLERFNFLSEFSCLAPSAECPPDHAYVFHCENKTQVLIVFERDGCVTLAEELDAKRFMEIFGEQHEC